MGVKFWNFSYYSQAARVIPLNGSIITKNIKRTKGFNIHDQNHTKSLKDYVTLEEKEISQIYIPLREREQMKTTRKQKRRAERTERVEGTEQLMLQSLQLSVSPFTKISNTKVADFDREKALGAFKNFTVTSEPWQRAPNHKREKTQQRQTRSAALRRPIFQKSTKFAVWDVRSEINWHKNDILELS